MSERDFEPPECLGCHAPYSLGGEREPAEHGLCWPCASEELDRLREAMSIIDASQKEQRRAALAAGVPEGSSPAVCSSEPIHTAFGLSYSSYLVIPRLALQEMPVEWQRRFVALLEQAHEEFGLDTPSDYHVTRRAPGGRFFQDPWSNYRRGTVAAARAEDERRRR